MWNFLNFSFSTNSKIIVLTVQDLWKTELENIRIVLDKEIYIVTCFTLFKIFTELHRLKLFGFFVKDIKKCVSG